MRPRLLVLATVLSLAATLAACSGGPSKPAPTPTPTVPGAVDVIAEWVHANRNVDFIGDCNLAKPGIDIGKLCVRIAGVRGTRRAYSLGPTFSDPTALAMVEKQKDGTWKVLSVTNVDLSQGAVPGIPWPLQIGDEVVIVGLAKGDCLRVRDQPALTGKQLACEALGVKAIIQDGPKQADNFTWWKIAGTGFSGWAADHWLRLPDAIAQALQPATPTPAAATTPAR
ncbi:MAG: hypothetical protein ACYDEB_08435 [Dehalococcoidia bacterium]